MSNILEFIDALLPQDKINIHYLELPQDEMGMLIEETSINGKIHSFAGYDGVISSLIQFYVRVEPKNNKYKEINALLKSFYKIVKNNKGLEVENIKLLHVGEFNLSPAMRDEKNNYVFSLMFPIIYKEME